MSTITIIITTTAAELRDERPQPIAIFHYRFPFNDCGQQVWNWRWVECFTLAGCGPGALEWHVAMCRGPDYPTSFFVEWTDTTTKGDSP